MRLSGFLADLAVLLMLVVMAVGLLQAAEREQVRRVALAQASVVAGD